MGIKFLVRNYFSKGKYMVQHYGISFSEFLRDHPLAKEKQPSLSYFLVKN
jgi:hypothetical protein